jgi:SAM-dependent methyltransferase
MNTCKKNVCAICGNEKAIFWYKKNSAIDGRSYDISKCDFCNSGFVYPPPTDEYLKEFYSGEMNSHGGLLVGNDLDAHYKSALQSEKEFPNSTIDANRIASFAKKYANGKDFLDIGAGYGFFTRAAKSQGFNCVAIEAGSNNCKIFELMNGFDPINSVLDDRFADANESSFDVVLLSQVLEHIPNPLNAARQISRVLKKDGLCIIAVPHFGSLVSKFQGKNDMFITPPEHVNLFSTQGLCKLFERCGFSLIKTHTISRYDRNKLADKIKPHLLSTGIYGGISLMLNISDLLKKGMFINSYFRKNKDL